MSSFHNITKTLLTHGSTTAFITGGESGLGNAVVNRLAKISTIKGVISFDLKNNPTKQQTNNNNNVIFCQGDVTNETDVQRGLALCETQFGISPRVVVNCAGIAPSVRVLGKKGVHPLSVFENTLKVNVLGTFNVLRLAAEKMSKLPVLEDVIDKQRGVIINTASIAAYDGQIGQAAYSASKGAIVGMCLPIARDLAQFGIRVVTIAPGVFKTPMVAGLPPDAQASLATQIPFPSRLGDPAEYAEFVTHICETVMLNGEVIRLDGALRMGPK
jgi:NAD(P)-dependent dehydrogenase (short-subunit alcohol dehydrogenase family)